MTQPNPANCRIEIWRDDVKEISDISERIISELITVHPLLDQGITGVQSLKIVNEDGVYTGLIHKFDEIKIFLWRQGDAEKKIFEGRIMSLGSEGSTSRNEYYITLECANHAQEILAPPELIAKLYKGISGKTILQEIVATLNKCTSTQYIDPDSDIDSTHDIEYDEIIPYNPIMQILRNAKTSGGIAGFDAYFDPDGKLHVFKRGKYTSGVTPQVLDYKRNDDVHRIRNKITIYGATGRTYPVGNIDGMTEAVSNTYGVWAVANWNSIEASTEQKFIGTKSIKISANMSGSPSKTTGCWFTWDSTKRPSCFWRNDYQTLNFYIWLSHHYTGSLLINLMDVTLYGSQYEWLQKRMSINKKEEFQLVSLPVGQMHDTEWKYTDSAYIGGFDWSALNKIEIILKMENYHQGYYYIDAAYLSGARFRATEEDVTSQTGYEVRCAKSIVDNSLNSDQECSNRGKLEIQNLKESINLFETFIVEGNNSLIQGYKLPVVLPIDDIDTHYRMLQIKHILRYTNWKSHLRLSEV